jgi:large subunit ribosomal protein L22
MSDKTAIKTESKPLVTASARQLHISPRKMRLVTNLVKNMYVTDALAQLTHVDKKAAPIMVKLLKSAVANAQNNFNLNPEWLYVKSITTDMGKVMKRYFPRARGSAFVIRRKLCHVNVILEERKRSGKAASRLSLFKKAAKAEDTQTPSVDAQDAANKSAKTSERKPKSPGKTSEQKKQNTVQNKRRLFNRKSGV